MATLWTSADQQRIKKISSNTIDAKFESIAIETQLVDLQPLIGFDFFQDLIQNPTATWNKNLLDGGTYVYNGVTYKYDGLKFALAYFFYARYVDQNGEFDTFGGMMNKNFEDGKPIDIGALKNRINSVRKVAFKYWEDCEKFIQANSSEFPKSMYNPLAVNYCCTKRRTLYF